MDLQLKRGLIEICVLKLLTVNDSYGYQLIKDVSLYIPISESTLYPILKRLEASSQITVYTVEYNSRLRKYYKITDKGRDKIKEFIVEWKEIVKVFAFIEGGEHE